MTKQAPAHETSSGNKNNVWPFRISVTTAAVLVGAVGMVLQNWGNIIQRQKHSSSAYHSWDATHPAAWDLGSDRCTLERISETDLSPQVFARDYWLQKPVIILRNASINEKAQRETLPEALIERLDDNDSARLPLAGMESYAFRGEERIGLREYLQPSKQQQQQQQQHHQSSTEQTATDDQHRLTSASVPSFSFGTDVLGVSEDYVVPALIPILKEELDLEWNFQLALAKSGAGLAFHWHGDAFAEVLHGRRRWFLTPPEQSPVFNPRHSSVQWMEEVYAPMWENNTDHPPNTLLQESGILECTLEANQALYVPADWYHSTLSLGQAVSITTSFAATFRRRRHKIPNGPASHAHMLDALGRRDFDAAAQHARDLTKHRPQNFHPYAWLGVILTFRAQGMLSSSEEEGNAALRVVEGLEEARAATAQCRELNPLYAPCQVWQYRQLEALARIHSEDEQRASELWEEAAACRQAARQLSRETDDEILDPRWQPKTMTKRARTSQG